MGHHLFDIKHYSMYNATEMENLVICFACLYINSNQSCFEGLNLQSQFNLENITVFNKNEQESTLGQKVCNDAYGLWFINLVEDTAKELF